MRMGGRAVFRKGEEHVSPSDTGTIMRPALHGRRTDVRERLPDRRKVGDVVYIVATCAGQIKAVLLRGRLVASEGKVKARSGHRQISRRIQRQLRPIVAGKYLLQVNDFLRGPPLVASKSARPLECLYAKSAPKPASRSTDATTRASEGMVVSRILKEGRIHCQRQVVLVPDFERSNIPNHAFGHLIGGSWRRLVCEIEPNEPAALRREPRVRPVPARAPTRFVPPSIATWATT